MLYSWITTIVFLSFVLGQIYFLGRYISTRQNIFQNNFFGSLMIGVVTYFALSFIQVLTFNFFSVSLLVIVIFHFIKDGMICVFLIYNRDKLRTESMNIKKDILTFLAFFSMLVIFTIIYHFGLSKISPLTFTNHISSRETWAYFKATIKIVSELDEHFIQEWIANVIVSFIALAAVGSVLFSLVRTNRYVIWAFILVITISIQLLLNFGSEIEGNANIFLLLFAFLLCCNINIFSRRRYGAFFGITVFASWGFNSNYFICYLLLSLTSSIVYTIFQKPKVTLFWVQLIAPIAIVATLWISEWSTIVGILLTVFAVGAYIFFIAAGRLESLVRLDKFFVRLRYWLPTSVLIIIIIAGSTLWATKTTESNNIFKNVHFMFDHFSNKTLFIIDAVFTSLFFIISCLYILNMVRFRRKILKHHIFLILIITFILFALNPFTLLMLSNIPKIQDQIINLSVVILPVIFCLGTSTLLNKQHMLLFWIKRNKMKIKSKQAEQSGISNF